MKKLKPRFITLCDLASVSNQGKLSIIGIFDRIFIQTTPTKFIKFSLVAILEGEPNSSHDLTLETLDPSNKPILESRKLTVKISNSGTANIIATFANLPLPATGEYTLALKAKDQAVGDTKFQVIKLPDKPTQPN